MSKPVIILLGAVIGLVLLLAGLVGYISQSPSQPYSPTPVSTTTPSATQKPQTTTTPSSPRVTSTTSSQTVTTNIPTQPTTPTLTRPPNAEPISRCTIIRRPGYYFLANNLEGTLEGEDYCILIDSDNVILDGNGKSINPKGRKAVVVRAHEMMKLMSYNITIMNAVFINASIAILFDFYFKDVTIHNNVFSSGIAIYTRNPRSSESTVFIYRCRISNNIFRDSSIEAELYECEITNNKFINGSLVLIDKNDIRQILTGRVKNVISYNEFQNGGLRFATDSGVSGEFRGKPMLYVVENNVVNGKPLIYLQNKREVSLENIEAGQIVIVTSEDIRIRNTKISKSEAGIVLYEVVGATISECDLKNNGYGIYVLSSRDIKIEKCQLDQNKVGILVSKTKRSSSKNIMINDITLIRNKKGLVIDGIEMLKIYRLNFRNNYVGAEITDSNNANVEYCQIEENDVGLQVSTTTNIEIKNINIINNKKGLSTEKVNNIIIFNLEIKGNDVGIMFNSTSNVNISNTKIQNNNVGVIFDRGDKISFTSNVIEKNELGVKALATFNSKLSKNIYTKNTQAMYILMGDPYSPYVNQISDSIFIENTHGLNISYGSKVELKNITLAYGKISLVVNNSRVTADKLVIKNYTTGIFVTDYSEALTTQCIIEKAETAFEARRSEITIMNCRLNNYRYGIVYFDELRRFNIVNNIFENGYTAIWIKRTSGEIWPAPAGNIIHNTIINNYIGINITKTGNILIYNNTFTKNILGIYLINTSLVDIRHNLFKEHQIAIYDYGYLLGRYYRNTIKHNKFLNNKVAIFVEKREVSIENNLMNRNNIGINITNIDLGTVYNNTITDNIYGIFLLNTSRISIERNLFQGNKVGVYDRGTYPSIDPKNYLLNNVFSNNEIAIHLILKKNRIEGNKFYNNINNILSE